MRHVSAHACPTLSTLTKGLETMIDYKVARYVQKRKHAPVMVGLTNGKELPLSKVGGIALRDFIHKAFAHMSVSTIIERITEIEEAKLVASPKHLIYISKPYQSTVRVTPKHIKVATIGSTGIERYDIPNHFQPRVELALAAKLSK